MDIISVIVPAHDVEATLRDALASAEESIACLRGRPGGRVAEVEVVVVDDGSRDGTLAIALEVARGKDFYRILRRARASSPACARNCGAAAARRSILLFLDADDLFLPGHIDACIGTLADPAVDFVKTAVALSDPVHPSWRRRIANSLVLNLAVRSRCHEAAGGLPDLHLFRRDGDGFAPELDVFRMIEDVYYNELLAACFRGRRLGAETVLYRRRPGNSFDRQYAKFQQPAGSVRDDQGEEFDFRVRLANLIVEREKRRLASHRGGPRPV